DAAIRANRALLFTDFRAAAANHDLDRPLFAHLDAAGHRALLGHHARAPHLDRLAIRRRAVAAVVPVAQALEAIAERLAAGVLLTAFPVAAIDAAGDHAGLLPVRVAVLHHGALFAHGNLHAHLAGHNVSLGNP